MKEIGFLALEGVGKNWEKSVFGKLLLASGIQKLNLCNMIKVIFVMEQRIDLDGLKRNGCKGTRGINPRRDAFDSVRVQNFGRARGTGGSRRLGTIR